MVQERQPFQEESTRCRPIIIIIIIIMAVLLASIALVITGQTRTIRKTLNDSAYNNMETLMQTIAGSISTTFSSDNTYVKSLASTIASPEDMPLWMETVSFDKDKVLNLYYSGLTENTAHGKNGKTLDLSGLIFTEHKGGQVRSGAYMTGIGNYAYLTRVPILRDGKPDGYLYGEFLMSHFYEFLPFTVTSSNDISLMEASTMHNVHVPSNYGSGMHINYDTLKYQLRDEALAEQILSEIQQSIQNRQFYMRLLRLYRADNGQRGDKEFIVMLWPIDDGEYYLSGISKVEQMQSERISVLESTNLMVGLMVGISVLILVLLLFFFSVIISENRKRVQMHQKHSEALDEALQIAKAANESKSNFLSNMSHDIRTPMNAIIGYTTLISKEADNAIKVREYTKKISDAGDYLLSLINDVLDMSKIESGKTTLNVSQFYIRELIDEVESIIRMQAEGNHQEFMVSVKNIAHESLMGDKLRIRQILLNLLSNALKYTPSGGTICFSIEGMPQKKKDIQKLRITVQDNGYGMDADYVKTIFDPFVRLNNSMTGKIQGTGLGLAITKNIVDLMGGTITVASALNQGSTFTVELELPTADDAAAWADTRDSGEGSEYSLEGLRILAAEDNELNAEILTELLGMEQVSCKVCGDGQKVLEEFAHCQPGAYDLILMDIQMPNMNGYEATRAIRGGSHPEAKTIPIIAMTANAFAEDVMEALQAGMDAHISKPVDMPTLKKTIKKVLKRKKEG